MASPQVDNGYTKIANEIVDELCKIRIPGEAMQILFFILRKTYGWNKKSDNISHSQFVKGTGIIRQHITRNIKKLEEMGLIVVTNNGYKNGAEYRFNKDYRKWKPVPKKVTGTNNGYKRGANPQNDGVRAKNDVVTNNGTGVTNNGAYKRHYTKENKDIYIGETKKQENPNTIKFQEYINEEFPHVAKLPKQITDDQFERIIKKYKKIEIVKTLKDMENKKDLIKKYRSVGLTLEKWLGLNYGQ